MNQKVNCTCVNPDIRLCGELGYCYSCGEIIKRKKELLTTLIEKAQ